MALSRKDFGANPHAGASRNNAASRGWGPGWPNCQGGRMATASGGGVRVSVRHEIVDLVSVLLELDAEHGYKLKAGQCWGFACRAIRGTSQASNHSWGLAVDKNSIANPMQSTFRTDMPPAVVADWEACGFYWGGRYENRPDPMHFEYLGSPADVAPHLAHAKALLAGLRNPAPKSPAPKPAGEKATDKHEPGSRTVKQGSRGTDVAFLQRWLGVETLGADGIFGPQTEAAVKRYQRMRALPQNGSVGPATWNHILGKAA